MIWSVRSQTKYQTLGLADDKSPFAFVVHSSFFIVVSVSTFVDRHDCLQKFSFEPCWSFACSHPIFGLQKTISSRNIFSLLILAVACSRTIVSSNFIWGVLYNFWFRSVNVVGAGIYILIYNRPTTWLSHQWTTAQTTTISFQKKKNNNNLLARSPFIPMRQVTN